MRAAFFLGHESKTLNKILETACGVIAGTALFAIMALTFLDVNGRKLMSNSIPGSLELTELLMVVVIFAAMPLVTLRGEHVVFDSLDSYLPAGLQKAQRAIVNVLCAGAMLALAWLMWDAGGQFMQSGETTAQLKILKAPFLYGMSVMCAVTGFIHLALIARPPRDLAEGEGVAL